MSGSYRRSFGSRPWRGRSRLALCGLALALPASGCTHLKWPFKAAPPTPNEALVLRDGAVYDPSPAKQNGELAAAYEAMRGNNFAAAYSKFHDIAEDERNSPQTAEEARFHEGECLYRQDQFPKAGDVFHKQVTTFPRGAYTDRAVQRMFEIANFWLDDTRKEMEAYRQNGGGSWLVMPVSVSFEKKKPLFDTEGRAMQLLDHIHIADPSGPLTDKALFLAGSVKFYRQDYRDADHYFTQILEYHKDSPLVPKALELAIMSKSLVTGGPAYDGRKLVEARQLVNTALHAYPEVRGQNQGFLERQLSAINYQQAAKDYEAAEFYERINKPASAWWCYETVKRRYPNTKYAEMAEVRMGELRQAIDEQQREAQAGGSWPKRAWNKLTGRESRKEGDGPALSVAPVGESAGPRGSVPRSLPNGL